MGGDHHLLAEKEHSFPFAWNPVQKDKPSKVTATDTNSLPAEHLPWPVPGILQAKPD